MGLINSLLIVIITFSGMTNAATTIKMTECVNKLRSCSSQCTKDAIQGADLVCTSTGNTNKCSWRTKKCECSCRAKTAADRYEENSNNGPFDKIVKKVVNKFKALTCMNEKPMWDTFGKLAKEPIFLKNIVETTMDSKTYEPVKDFTLKFHQFFDKEICESDHFIRNAISKISKLDDTNGKADAVGSAIDDLLKPIYTKLKPDIDSFSEKLDDSQKNTAIAITYTGNVCLDIKFEMCYGVGFGVVFNFRNQHNYYQTGAQALTIKGTDGKSFIPKSGGSISFDVAYDILGNISYAPGALYSLDASISPGIGSQLTAGAAGAVVSNGDKNFVKDTLLGGGFAISYLVGVNSLALSDFSDTSKCLGLEFVHSLQAITSDLIPSAAFGISRVVTVKAEDITQNQGKTDYKNKCVAEQLWSVTGGKLLRPDIEL